MTGDQRLTENLILEVRALAKRFGLGVADIQIRREPKVRPKRQRRSK